MWGLRLTRNAENLIAALRGWKEWVRETFFLFLFHFHFLSAFHLLPMRVSALAIFRWILRYFYSKNIKAYWINSIQGRSSKFLRAKGYASIQLDLNLVYLLAPFLKVSFLFFLWHKIDIGNYLFSQNWMALDIDMESVITSIIPWTKLHDVRK